MNNSKRIGKVAGLVSSVIVLLFFSMTSTYASVVYAIPMSAKEADMGVVISWTTASEQATDYFAIFKSTDGVAFEQIGEEQAMGDYSERKNYRFLDTATGDTKAFYRLLQVDLDGEQAYTHISVVHKKNPNNFMVTMMGNTTTDRYFNVVFKSENAGHMTYRLLNLNNEVVKRGVINIDQGQNLFTLDLEQAESGRYNFSFTMNEEEEKLILIKSSEDVMVKKN